MTNHNSRQPKIDGGSPTDSHDTVLYLIKSLTNLNPVSMKPFNYCKVHQRMIFNVKFSTSVNCNVIIVVNRICIRSYCLLNVILLEYSDVVWFLSVEYLSVLFQTSCVILIFFTYHLLVTDLYPVTTHWSHCLLNWILLYKIN